MTEITPLFQKPDGQRLYWAAVEDEYEEDHFTIVFTYARTREFARSYFFAQYEAVVDITVLSENDLNKGRVVAAAVHWAVTHNDSPILQACLDAYKIHGHQPPESFLLEAAEKGHAECFNILRPHFTLAWMGDAGKTNLAYAVGQGGSVDILSNVVRHFLPLHFETSMEAASIAHHEHMIATLANHCSAQKVLDRMRCTSEEDQYRTLEQWVAHQQQQLLNRVVSEENPQTNAHVRRKI